MTTITEVQRGQGDPWSAPVATGPVRATVTVPGSKSGTNRALVLAAAADGVSRLRGALRSRDTVLMAAALRELGATVTDEAAPGGAEPGRPGEPGADQGAADIVVTGPVGAVRGTAAIDCGNAGTVARFTPALATLARGDVRFDGDPRMRDRPLAPLLRALRELGAHIDGDRMPFTVRGTGAVSGGAVTVDASDSSQLVSGLLLAAARFERGATVTHAGHRLPSGPYLDMTVADLRAAGVVVDVDDPTADLLRAGGTPAASTRRWRVEPGGPRPLDRVIEPDLNSAAPFVAAAAVTGGEMTITGWPASTEQPGRMLPDLLVAMGCRAELVPEGLRVTGGGRITGIDVDLSDFGEAAPVLTGLAVLADSPSRLRGIAHLRLQETDRLAALASELGRLGARVTVTDDGLSITPVPLRGARLDPHADHRLAMTYAVVGLAVPGVTVDDIATTGKTVPDFARMWTTMLAG
ncbi:MULTISPECIES: 3-phosphoshikimate 1-carboxyvinyltransferase [unclassified Parafrankia]|uniref:3-phosphoshikimate 1-carboxyvinyltransferase n=1 Tax=unclassified Parafrankia TaxID=2994368 RepID=UPI000DA51D58|nr:MULTISPECIES: 3-phosphoshikimate 1-carboxyvinyltransferase [unclassified Parafrankia]SQD98437.1 3-phosphoshikimate 1-carboxyvinyltransferase [Parafrankia sp. Ea1.12]